jgi:hypothetical protein
MRARLNVVWLILVVCLAAAPAAAERRMALVIGNGNYANIQKLPNPTNDANGMAAALRSLGFEVLHRNDVDRQQMITVLGDFELATRDADVALIYYAGHAVQVNGENYLLPTDIVDADQQRQVTLNAIRISETYVEVAGRADTVVVILDSCRNNPFSRGLRGSGGGGSGLASMSPRSGRNGSYIAFATAPGDTAEDGAGANSPYTAALLRHLSTPDIDIDLMMARVGDEVRSQTFGRQVPWRNSSLSSRGFRFLPSGSPQVQHPPPPPQIQAACSPASEDIKLWQLFQSQNTPEAYEKYLSLCANGLFVAEARRKIEDLQSIPDWYLLLYADLDFWGGDTTPKGIEMETAEKCAQHCAADTGCKLFSYNSEKKQCYTKNRLDLPVAFPGVLSGVFQKRDPGATGAPVAKSIVARFVAHPNEKHAGPINSKWQKRIGSIDSCLRICDRDKDCVAATWGDRQSNGSRCAMRFIGILKDIFGRSDDFGSTAFDKKTVLVQPAKDPIPLPGLNLAKQ